MDKIFIGFYKVVKLFDIPFISKSYQRLTTFNNFKCTFADSKVTGNLVLLHIR